jgi:hypothetical protein
MDWPITLATFAIGVVMTVYFSVRGRRPADSLKVPLIPLEEKVRLRRHRHENWQKQQSTKQSPHRILLL